MADLEMGKANLGTKRKDIATHGSMNRDLGSKPTPRLKHGKFLKSWMPEYDDMMNMIISC